jgi:transcriptional regulator with XRE-family HTH domain
MADLKQFRKQNNLTQDELGEYLGIKKSFISRIENGFHKLPHEKLSKLLENNLGWNVSALLTSNESEEVYSTSSGFESVVPAEVVEEIKEEVAQAESVPILSEDLSTATDIDIRSYIDENGDELERINPSQLLQQADLAERVMRTSMLPTFAPGDIIFIRFMKDKAKLIDGETYYFDLKSLPTMIRKVKIEGEKLRLIAQNPNFGDIITTRADIVSVAKIVGLLRMTFTDFYSDIDEARKQKEAQISNMIESHTTQVDCLIKEISKFGERENRLIDILEKKL